MRVAGAAPLQPLANAKIALCHLSEELQAREPINTAVGRELSC